MSAPKRGMLPVTPSHQRRSTCAVTVLLALATTAGGRAQAQGNLDEEIKALRATVEGLKAKNAELQVTADQAKASVAGAKQQAEAAKKQAADAIKQAKDQANHEVTAAKEDMAKHGLDAINSLKFVNVSIGVLPNSDHKANTQANLNLNYTPEFTTELRYLDRNLGRSASISSTIPASSDGILPAINRQSSASTSTDNIRIDLTALKYRPAKLDVAGTTVQPSFGIGVDQLRSNTSRFIISTESFPDPKSGIQRDVITTAQISETTISTLPLLSADLAASDAHGFKIDLGAGIIVGSQESYSWQENGTGSIPALSIDNTTGAEIPSQTVELHDNKVYKFKSSGFETHIDLGYETKSHGFRLHGDYLLKEGNRKSYELDVASADPIIDQKTGAITNPGAKTISESQSSVKETVAQGHGSLGWKMKFLERYGVVPELTIDMEVDRTLLAKDGVNQSDVTKQYAVGVLFDY